MPSALIRSKRFLPLFITQFFGAFNDNLFRNALAILITYKLASSDSAHAGQLVNLAFGLFTLPMLLFSYLAGQLADKVDRARVARAVKIAEIALALLGSVSLWLNNVPLLLLTLFGFGLHSTFFGPVKYAILPQHLAEDELVAGNGYVEAGTFLAILIGTLLGGTLDTAAVALLMTGAALVGYASSRAIPPAPGPAPHLTLSLNPWTETIAMIRHSAKNRTEYLCILGTSWFWFMGSIFIAQFPPFVKYTLHADEHMVTLLLVAFSIGIAIGSMLCARLIRGFVRATYVPFGALGMSVCGVDLYCATRHAAPPLDDALMSWTQFLSSFFGWHIALDFMGLAICGGVYVVALYALLQVSADREHGGRAIATNNIVNSVFMVAAALLAMLLIKLGFTIPEIFLTASIMNAGVAVYTCKLLPFSIPAAILKLLYRVDVRGLENWKKAGDRVLIVANHTSFLDAMIFASFLPERVGFAVNTFIAQKWWIRILLKLVDAYPVDPTNPMAAKRLIDQLKKNKKIMIFPEGRLTMTGSLMKIYEGPGMIADKSGAIILPGRIDGAQYSPLSKLKGKVRIRWFPKVTLTLMPPRHFDLPDDLMGRRRRQRAGAQLYDLMSQMIFESSPAEVTLMQSLFEARRIHGGKHIIAEDPKRAPVNYRSFITRSLVLSTLIKKATGDEQRVGLMLPNMTATAVAFFAIQALGRAAAMLNFTAGPGQIRSACGAAAVKTVLTSRQFIEMGKLDAVIESLRLAQIKIIYLEDLASQVTWAGKFQGLLGACFPRFFARAACHAKASDNAVILFTSGSEGTPKGVALSHRNILANRYQLASRIDFGPQDIVFNCLPMFHAFGLTGGTLLPLLSGIKVFFYPSPLHYRIVSELIYDTNATILFGTNTFLAGYARLANPYDFYALRYVFAGAEKLKEETRRAWFDKFGIRIFEGYGATETAPVLSANTAMHYRAGTVGRIMPGIETRLEEVAGITNGKKLHVRGPNIMLGYLKDDQPGVLQPLTDGWYDTGDIVAVDDDGYITIQGRTKRFAKIAGEMVSLTAVEDIIAATWPSMNHAVVSIPDPKKGEALVLITENAEAETSVLQEKFRELAMSELSVPRRIIKVQQVPLLGTGKTDYIKAAALANDAADETKA